MSGVQAVRAGAAVAELKATSATSAPASLLPDAAPVTAAGLTDAMGALYMAISQLGQSQAAIGASEVASHQQAAQQAIQQEQAAIQREQANAANHGRGFFSSIGHLVSDVTNDALHLKVEQLVKDTVGDSEEAWNSPAFWSDLEKGSLVVAKVAAAVGSAVVTVGTLGTGAPTLAVAVLLISSTALPVAGEVVSDTHCFGNGSQWVALGLDAAGAVAGGVAGGMAAAKVGTNAAMKTVAAVGISIKAAGGEAQVVEAGAHVETQEFAANVVDASADAQQDVDKSQQWDTLVAWEIDQMKDQNETNNSTLQTVQGVIQTNDRTTAAAAASISVRG